MSARTLVKATLMAAGVYARRLRRQTFPGVVVLNYHGLRRTSWPRSATAFANLHATIEAFECHCRLIRETCDPISLDDWRAARSGSRRLPDRPVVITFDDGYRTVLTLGVPVLQRFALPAAVFVCSEPVRSRTLLWFDAVARKRGEAAVEPLKSVGYNEWKTAVGTGVPASDDDPQALLTPGEVAEISSVDGFEVGAHTANHPILASATPDVQRCEIAESKRCLEQWTGRPVRAFAYPNGRPHVDYTTQSVGLVRELGFDLAFSTRSDFAKPSDDPLEYPRFLMLSELTATELAHRLSYSWAR